MNPPFRVPISSNTFMRVSTATSVPADKSSRGRSRDSRPLGDVAEQFEQAAPPLRRIDAGADINPAHAVTFEMTMLQIDARRAAGLGPETYFHLARRPRRGMLVLQ